MRSVIVCVLSGMALATAVTAQQQAPPTPPPCVAAGDVQSSAVSGRPRIWWSFPAASGLLRALMRAPAESI